MKPFLRQQLERHVQRLGELDFLLSREDILQDMVQFMALSREHADVAATAQRYDRYRQCEADRAAAQQWLDDPNADASLRGRLENKVARMGGS